MERLEGAGLDRLEERRQEPERSLYGPETRVVHVHEGRVLHTGDREPFPRLGEPHRVAPADLFLLGELDGVRYAAAIASDEAEAASLESATGGRFEGLRWLAARLVAPEAGIVAYAASLCAWHRTARHCGRCGSRTRVERAGQQRVCPSCDAILFPRTDPAIITLVYRGDRCILINQPGWEPNRYSTVAGFVEPGESLEQAVAREVREELGLEVVGLTYRSSQPWPFPHSIMIGFYAEVGAGEAVPGEEVRAARWLSRAELAAAEGAGEVMLSTPFSISRALIEEWRRGDPG